MKSIFRKIFVSFLLVALLQASTSERCMGFTVGEERKMGEQLLYQIRLAFPLLDDPDISQYINELGGEVLEVAGFQYFDYHFYIVQSSQFNAFAAPSGLVFFYSGLIEQVKHEDELVSVLAHEIGHVVGRHIAKGIDKGAKIGVASTLLAIAGLALGAGAVGQALLTGSLAAGQSANLYFSRKHEEEADLLAYGWMKEMGRHPRGQESMLKTMRRITRYTMGNNVPQYLLTHPHPELRLDHVQSLIDYESNTFADYGVSNDFAFLRTKYRILSLVKDGKQLRNLLNNGLADKAKGADEKVMARYGLSQLDRLENNYDSSRKLLEEVIAHFPHESILEVDLGLLEMEAGNRERALSLLQSAYKRNSHDMWAAFQLARVWLATGELGKAEKYLLRVQEKMADYSKVYFELGKLKSAKKEKGAASYYLGKYNLYEGRLKIARHNFQEAAKDPGLDPDLKRDIKETVKLIERLEKKK